MGQIERSVEINAAIGKVFDFVVSEWQDKMSFFGGMYNWRPTTDKPFGKGSRFAYSVALLGIKKEIEMEISDFSKNEKWTSTAITGLEAQGQWIFAPISDNKTKFTYNLRYVLPLPIVAGLIDKFLFTPKWEKIIESLLENLKKYWKVSYIYKSSVYE